MKTNSFLVLFLCISIQVFGQSKFVSSDDLFGQRVFIKNNGQFDGILQKGKLVDYAYSNGDEQVYFNREGVTYLLQKKYPLRHWQMEALEHGKKIDIKPSKKAYVNVSWENSNPNVEIMVSDKQSHYQSYGDSKLKSECYKKITYKNIYDNIDIEYVFTEDRNDGIKYTIIVHPGGNLDQVKIKYDGDVKKVMLKDGNVIIKTAIRNIVELAPISFQDGVSIVSNFRVENNFISFELPNSYDKTKDLSIDPWVINLALANNNYGYDVDNDYAGNYFVYGGSGPYLISKYSPSGILLWTFNGAVSSIGWTSIPVVFYPSNFIVDKVSGKCYTGQGFNYGTSIIRLSESGMYDNLVSIGNSLWEEVWDMGYDCNSGKIFGIGGGTTSNASAGILDTNTAIILPQNFTNTPYAGQDIVSHAIDSSGTVFFLFSTGFSAQLNNTLLRTNSTFNGNDWAFMPTNYNSFEELMNKIYPNSNLGTYNSNGYNALAVNNDYLYYYDGFNLAAYSKTTGIRIAFTTLAGQIVKQQGGIAVDECNNIYVGGNGFTKCFNFNGTTFTPNGSIPVASTSSIQYITDIKLNQSSNELYVCGSGFGGVYLAINSGSCSNATIGISQTQVAINNTTALATITTSVVDPIITYTWLNATNTIVSQTNNSTSLTNIVENLPNGTYSVIAQFSAPCGFTTTQTFVVSATSVTPTFTQVNPICSGALLANLPTTSINGITGSWTPALNNTATTTYTFTPNLGQDATTATMTITVNNPFVPSFAQVSPICTGSFLANLATTSTNAITGAWSPPINNTQTSQYTFTPAIGQCATIAQMTIVVNQPIVPTFSQVAVICAGGIISNLPTTSTNAFIGTWSPPVNNNQTTLYTFAPAIGQCATTAQMTIVVNQPIVPAFNQVAAICAGEFLSNLPTTSDNAVIGTWSPALDNTQTTLYTFAPTIGQCATTAQMTIVVSPFGTPTFTQVLPICSGDSLANLPTTSENAYLGTWSPTLDNTQTTLYTFTPAIGQCATAAQMTIEVNPIQIPTFTQIPSLCYQDFAPALPTTDLNGIVGTWQPTVVSNTASGNYIYTPTIGQCANTNFPMSITVFDDFDFEIKAACVGSNFVLQVVPLANSFDVNQASFNWENSSNVSVGTNSSTFDVTKYFSSNTILPVFPLLFTADVTLSNGCIVSHDVSLTSIFCSIQAGISPNNDGKNEFFDLQLLNVKKLEIFNRYGTKVYSKANYINEWVGQCDDGGILPDGVYYYVIDFESGRETKVGWIYLTK